MNNVNIIGRITNDLEIRVVGNDLKVLSFSVAYNQRRGEKEEVSFFEITAWGKQAEIIATYFKKGHRIAVSGRLKQDRYTDKDGNNRSRVTIVLGEFSFIETKSETSTMPNGSGAQNYTPAPAKRSSEEADFSKFNDAPPLEEDDVPF